MCRAPLSLEVILQKPLKYRLINESRRIAGARGLPSAALNGLIAEFNDLGFVATQALAIRRLTEQEYKDPAKQVISLRRLFDNLRKHCRLFATRSACHASFSQHYVSKKEGNSS
jgi:hypothetical protein